MRFETANARLEIKGQKSKSQLHQTSSNYEFAAED
jgi:hypothetical protein